jgi:hypothetical protein
MMINLALLTSPNGTVVGTINATDPDNNPLTYSITDGNPDTDGDNIKAFAIRSCREHLTYAMSINTYRCQQLENLQLDHKEK